MDLVERLGLAAVDLGGIAEGARAQQFGGGIAAMKRSIELLGNQVAPIVPQ